MSASRLQDKFLAELAETFAASQRNIAQRLGTIDLADATARDAVVREELRGLYHGLLVIFDGGTSLADHGLVSIVDEDGVAFDRFLHEICFRYWPNDA